jgi:hypothetical protein
MKNMTGKMMIAAAFLAVAGVASAETMTATIPFAFRAGGKVLSPGTYTIFVNGGRQDIVKVANFETKEAALVLTRAPEDPSKDWKPGDGVLIFACSANRCVLDKLWTGGSNPAVNLPHPGVANGEPIAYKVIHLDRVNGD